MGVASMEKIKEKQVKERTREIHIFDGITLSCAGLVVMRSFLLILSWHYGVLCMV